MNILFRLTDGTQICPEEIITNSSFIQNLLKDCPNQEIQINWDLSLNQLNLVLDLMQAKTQSKDVDILLESIKLSSYLDFSFRGYQDLASIIEENKSFHLLEKLTVSDLCLVLNHLKFSQSLMDYLNQNLFKSQSKEDMFKILDRSEMDFRKSSNQRIIYFSYQNDLCWKKKEINCLVTDHLKSKHAWINMYMDKIYYLNSSGHLVTLNDEIISDTVYRKIFEVGNGLLLEGENNILYYLSDHYQFINPGVKPNISTVFRLGLNWKIYLNSENSDAIMMLNGTKFLILENYFNQKNIIRLPKGWEPIKMATLERIVLLDFKNGIKGLFKLVNNSYKLVETCPSFVDAWGQHGSYMWAEEDKLFYFHRPQGVPDLALTPDDEVTVPLKKDEKIMKIDFIEDRSRTICITYILTDYNRLYCYDHFKWKTTLEEERIVNFKIDYSSFLVETV